MNSVLMFVETKRTETSEIGTLNLEYQGINSEYLGFSKTSRFISRTSGFPLTPRNKIEFESILDSICN